MKKLHEVFSENSKINQILCAVLINLPVFTYGANIGWMSTMALLLQSEKSPRDLPLTKYEISWMAAIPYLISIPGTFLMSFLGDTIGRRNTLLLISATCATSWILLLSSLELWSLIIARALMGFLMAGCFVTCPIYTNEISEDSIKGSLDCLVVLFRTTGNLCLYVIGDMLRYRTILWICLSLPTFHIILFMMMPDSPSSLIKRGQNDEAVRVLAWLQCKREDDKSIKERIDLIRMEQKNDARNNCFLVKVIWNDCVLSKAFYIVLVSTLARELCGSVPILNFSGYIFKNTSTNSSLVLTPNQESMLLGVVQVFASMFASIIVNKTRRKVILLITALLSGLSMFLLASWFVVKDYRFIVPNWIPIVTLCISIFCDSIGLQPVSIVLCREIFSYKYRHIVMATTASLSAFADFLEVLFFQPLVHSIGIYVVFFFFGAACIFFAVFVITVIPETKGKSLVEIYKHFTKK